MNLLRQALGMFLAYTGGLLALPGCFLISLSYKVHNQEPQKFLIVRGLETEGLDDPPQRPN